MAASGSDRMTPPAERRPQGSRRWVKGCALGCVLLLLLLGLVGAGGYVLVKRTVERIRGIETVMEQVRERHGRFAEFCPDPDGLVRPERLEAFLRVRELMAPARAEDLDALRQHERTGRPLGSEAFVEKVGMLIGRDLRKKKPGRKAPEGAI